MKKIGIISDTHCCFDETIRDFLGGVDEIWHAGDFGSIETADAIFPPTFSYCAMTLNPIFTHGSTITDCSDFHFFNYC